MQLTPATPLSQLFIERVRPPLEAVASHELFRRVADGAVTLDQCRRALLGFYPLVEAFPCYMSFTLAQMRGRELPRGDEARAWIEANIRTEARHAEWWIDWGRLIGLQPDDFTGVQRSAAIDAQTHYLFRTARTGTVAEAVAAVNYAVEGATGLWTRAIAPGIPRLGERYGLTLDRRVMRWLRMHMRYDDAHPEEALEIVKACARDEREMERAARAAVRSLEYFSRALDDALVA